MLALFCLMQYSTNLIWQEKVNQNIVIRKGKIVWKVVFCGWFWGLEDSSTRATSDFMKCKHWMCRKIKTTVFFIWPVSWSTDVSSFYYSDVNLFLIGLHFIYHSWYISDFETTYKNPHFIKEAIFFWSSSSIKLLWLQRRSNKSNTILYDSYYFQNCKAMAKKIVNHARYRKPNVPSHFNIFWLNFDKANHSFLHPFLLLREIDFSKGAAWRKILRFLSAPVKFTKFLMSFMKTQSFFLQSLHRSSV